jgi:hypothetical protein
MSASGRSGFYCCIEPASMPEPRGEREIGPGSTVGMARGRGLREKEPPGPKSCRLTSVARGRVADSFRVPLGYPCASNERLGRRRWAYCYGIPNDRSFWPLFGLPGVVDFDFAHSPRRATFVGRPELADHLIRPCDIFFNIP